MRRIALLAACNAVASLRLSRRQTLAGIAGVAPLVPANAYAAGNLGAALAVFSASNPTVSPFTGFYKDPEHLEDRRTHARVAVCKPHDGHTLGMLAHLDDGRG